MYEEVTSGLAKENRKQAELFLRKFLNHVTPNKLAVCGGLATRFHLKRRGIAFSKRPFNDLDLLVEKTDDIKPSALSDFMLYHYHPPGVDDPVEPTYFFYAFVDPNLRIKADVFPYRWSSPERFVKARFGNTRVNVVGVEDQLIQCLYDVSRISEDLKVDPKQLDDVHMLLKIADYDLVEKIWIQNSHPSYPKSFSQALQRAEELKRTQPNWWREKPYRKPKPYKCARCQNRRDYPITDMTKIYKVLGYVE